MAWHEWKRIGEKISSCKPGINPIQAGGGGGPQRLLSITLKAWRLFLNFNLKSGEIQIFIKTSNDALRIIIEKS